MSADPRRCWALDVEGTLLRLPVAIEEVREALRVLAAGRGVVETFKPLLPGIAEVASRLGAQLRLLASFGGSAVEAQFMTEAYEMIERHELQAAPRASLCAGARELLAEAGSRAEPVLLVSNSAEVALRAAFRTCRLELGDKVLVGRRAGLAPKPDPAPLYEAIAALPELPELLVCVGDRVPDQWMARAAAPLLAARGVRVQAIGVAAEESTRAKLSEAGADQVVASLRELLRDRV